MTLLGWQFEAANYSTQTRWLQIGRGRRRDWAKTSGGPPSWGRPPAGHPDGV